MLTVKSQSDTNTTATPVKETLRLTKAEWLWPLAFMLSMSMLGLQFPLGYLLVPLIIIDRYRHDRYEFIVMLTIFCGKFALIHESFLGVKTPGVVFIISLIGLFIFRKPPILKKLTGAFAIYAASLMVFMLLSEESFFIQIRGGLFNYLSFAYFIIPLMAFSGRQFDIDILFRKLFPYALIFATYYLIDGAILNASFLMPLDASRNFTDFIPTFYHHRIHLFSMEFPRRWPAGLLFFTACIYPLAHKYKLTKGQWLLVIIAFMISRTFTIIIAFIFVYILVQGRSKALFKYTVFAILSIVALYFIDSKLGGGGDALGGGSSTLRIKSSIDQLIDIRQMQDDEDLAELGSGRMAQVIPKVELLWSMDREWIGFGFISRGLTHNSKYIIENDLYSDIQKAEEVATGVEVVPIQIILNIGIIGLIIHILFFTYTWWVIRKLKYSMYYLSSIVAFVIIGLTGFTGLIYALGLYMTGLSLAAVIMANKRQIGGFDLPEEINTAPQ